ncbi:MAG: carboxypeptidase-like regulatory domain-containing protein [Phycisphaerae bacterium]|nr:carboxypeptidase-like regulatory domain-containing protein [Phycisphaerae bacterium]
MNQRAWAFLCIPLLMGFGCASSLRNKIPAEPNAPQDKLDISTDKEASEVEPNAPERPVTYVLSGSLGVENVTLYGLPGDPNTQANGTYRVTLAEGWSGTVTPKKEGITFLPPSRTYAPFTQDIDYEIYLPQKISPPLPDVEQTTRQSGSQALTGCLELNGHPVPGITVRTIATSASAVTDANGCFLLQVPSDWQGTLRLDAPGPTRTTKDPQQINPVLVSIAPVETTDCVSAPPAAVEPEPEPPAPEASFITLGPSSLSTQATEELRHDLKVMCRLLSEQALGLSLVKRDPNTEPRAIYIPDDGVLFDIGIDWPLVGQLPERNVPDQSMQWQKASEYIDRRYEPEDILERLHYIKTRAYLEKMTDCLVHASHIRHLADDSSITLHIWGPAPSKDCLIRTDKKAIDDHAEAVLTQAAFAEQVTLKLH